MDLSEVSENQNRHPWELSRTACILRQLKRLGIHGNVLDIGCGDSYFDRRLLAENPDLTVYGVDIYLKNEIHEGNLHAVSSLDLLPDMKFDFILMMDVLEHIEDDRGYLKEVTRKYLNGGGILSSPFRRSTPCTRCMTRSFGISAATTTGSLRRSSQRADLGRRDGRIFTSRSFSGGCSRKTKQKISASGRGLRWTSLRDLSCGC